MDDLYGDLENYNEVNIVEELSNENNQLKLKLEEYETAMGKLQEDYDKLTLEFHNLQLNYSSLLKTARAEVVRKAETITQLHLANDMKVLETLQKGNIRRTLANKNRHENVNKTANSYSSKDAKCDQKPKDDLQRNERCKVSSVSTSTNMRSNNTKLNSIDKVIDRVDERIYKSDLKEKVYGYDSKYKDAPNISTRRKSMNADVVPKFSSDDESEQEKPHKIRSDIPLADISASNVNKVLTRTSNERFSMKTSDTSSIEGRNEESRDSNRSRNNICSDNQRYRESDRFRESDRPWGIENAKIRDNEKGRVSDKQSDTYREFDNSRARDKYESSHRYRKHYSPDRPYKRSYREYQDDYYRTEYGRRKQEHSHHENYGRYRQKSHEHQPHYDRDCYRHPYEERRASKSYDEPNKRQKLESEISVLENKRFASNTVVMSTGDNLTCDVLHTSCQSPDMTHPPETHTDAVPTHTIKEIKSTATMPLEDPRVTSKKYILGNENGATFLYTISSQNINIKPINKSLWNIKSVPLPDALLHYPLSDLPEENIKEIYMSIGNPDSNKSEEISYDSQDIKRHDSKTMPEKILEEGESSKGDTTLIPHEQKSLKQNVENQSEISMCIENYKFNKTVKNSHVSKHTTCKSDKENKAENTSKCSGLNENISEILLKDKPSKEHVKQGPATDMSVNNRSIESGEISDSSEKPILVKTLTDPSLSKYSTEIVSNYKSKEEHIKAIPKTYKIPKLNKSNQSTEISDFYKGLPKIECEELNIHKTICTAQDVQVPHQNLPHIDVNDDVISSSILNEKYGCKLYEQNSKSVSDIAMVQDDLELSDETSDNFELHGKVVADKEVTEKPQLDMERRQSHKVKPAKILCERKSHEAMPVNTKEDKPKDTDSQRKKSKKKKIKSKEVELGKIADNPSIEEKRSKKDKDTTPEQIKNKFSDLFGDSSSLIMPEDLGIPISGVPFCDDGQDAVDINIKTIISAPVTDSVTVEEKCSSRKIDNKETRHATDHNNPNIEDKALPKKLEEEIKSSQLDTNIVYQNINYDTTDKQEIVKTVIISSGVQPQLILDDENRTTENSVADVEVNIQNIANCHVAAESKNHDSINALATCTPFKELCLTKNSDDCSENDCIINNKISKAESVDKACFADHSDTNTHDSIDPPDVRIFVRRRRKVLRKT